MRSTPSTPPNYINWVLRIYVRDHVFCVQFNRELFEDVQGVPVPTPTKKHLRDHLAASEINALRAYQDTQLRLGGNGNNNRDGGRQRNTGNHQRDRDRGHGRERPKKARIQNMEGCPPDVHTVFDGRCMRCGAEGHSSGVCPIPRDASKQSDAQKAKVKKCSTEKKTVKQTRNTWMDEQRKREAGGK